MNFWKVIQTAERETGAPLRGKKEGMLGMRGWRKELAMRLSGIQESRNSEIQKFRNSGIQESRNAGSQEFRNLEFRHQPIIHQNMTRKLSQQLEKDIEKASKIIKKSIKINEKSIQNEVKELSGAAPDPDSTPNGSGRPCAIAASAIWTRFSSSKSIKFSSKKRLNFI